MSVLFMACMRTDAVPGLAATSQVHADIPEQFWQPCSQRQGAFAAHALRAAAAQPALLILPVYYVR